MTPVGLQSKNKRTNSRSNSIYRNPKLEYGLILVQRIAEVAELADALGSGPSGLTMPVEVQVLSSALYVTGGYGDLP